MKRIARTAAAIAAALALCLSFAPAQATNGTNNPTWSTPTTCAVYRNVSTCAFIEWHRQADDTGVTFDGVAVYTGQGCDHLAANPNAYANVDIYDTTPDGTIFDQYVYGYEPCDWHHYPTGFVGQDAGNMVFHLFMKARLDGVDDRLLDFTWRVTPNGDSTVTKQISDCGC